ncbi:MAG: glycerol-3-phosphate acyltransferase [Lachnospiraceae bacterium]|nr:glycerol-3-phosphate acyltransferase [Lachnospiraceae bacterium]
MAVLFRFIALGLGYLCGNFESGFFYGLLHGVDLRTKGSGNIGTTNTLRNLGLGAGILTLVLDCLKAVIPAVVVYFFYPSNGVDMATTRLCMLYASFGAVLGHDFAFILKFKGGKGIASSLGMILVGFLPTLPFCVATFAITLAISKYVSLGSILTAVCFAVTMPIFAALGFLPYEGTYLIEACVIGFIAAALAIFLHRSNIDRLIHHNENKFSFHPKKAEEK